MKHANLPRQLQAQVQSIPAYPDAPYEKAGSTINQEARDNGHAAADARAKLMEVRRENDGSLEKAESEAIVGARTAPPPPTIRVYSPPDRPAAVLAPRRN